MSVFYDLSKTPRNILNKAIVRAIVSENNGLLFDPSDMSTLYQDAAGTTPVTAVEQPVGKIIDKSGNGNHATQSITASRPTLSARYNLLTKTEDFSDAAWVKGAGGTGSLPVVTNNYGIAPDGSQTACRVQLNKGSGTATSDISQMYQSCEQLLNTYYSRSVYVKLTSGSEQKTIFVDNIGGSSVGQEVIVTNQWKLIDLYIVAEVTTTRGLRVMCRGGYGTSASADILIWHPQVVLRETRGPYQRVNSSMDYDTNPALFPKYLRFDGIDDYMNLPYMGLYANGSVSVVMAGRASAQWGVVISEGSTTSGSPQFAPLLTTTETGDTLVVIRDDNNGNVLLHYTPSMFDKVSVVSSIISASDSKAYRDSVFKTALSYTRSTPVTMNTTAIGARVSTSVVEFFGGNIYGLIITKSALTDAQRIKCERHVARKAGVIL